MNRKTEITENSDSKSYRQIIKSTSIMGGSQAVSIILRIVRMKVLAVLLGPSGVGIIGVFDSITGMVNAVSGMGIGTSGVRQIAEANASGDEAKIARTIITLRRTAILTGLAGLVILLFLCYPVSSFTFGSTDHALEIAFLSVTIFFSAITGGQTALIQGMQRIRDLAFLTILGALWGTLFSIPVVYFFGEKGIVIFLIIVSGMNLLSSWWFSRKIQIERISMSLSETLEYLKPLLKLGVVFMSTALISLGSMFLIRVFIVRSLGLEAAGMYQAAITLSALYVGFILDAMGKDFFPRLTSVANNHSEFISLVNKQMEVGLLIAIPGVLATMTFSQFIIQIFYSAKFLPAYDILRWQLLGDVLRIMTWPLGFMLLAKGNSRIFFRTELLGTCFHVGLVWICITYFGLVGTGIAFFGLYLFYGLMMMIVVKRNYNLKLNPETIKNIVITALLSCMVFLSPYILPDKFSLLANFAATIIAALFSIKTLYKIIGPQVISELLSKIKLRLSTR